MDEKTCDQCSNAEERSTDASPAILDAPSRSSSTAPGIVEPGDGSSTEKILEGHAKRLGRQPNFRPGPCPPASYSEYLSGFKRRLVDEGVDESTATNAAIQAGVKKLDTAVAELVDEAIQNLLMTCIKELHKRNHFEIENKLTVSNVSGTACYTIDTVFKSNNKEMMKCRSTPFKA